MGKQWKQCQTLFLGAPKSVQMVIAAMKLKDTYWLPGISTSFCVWRVLPVLHYKRCKCQAQVLVSHSPLQLRHEHMTQALPINIQKAEIMAYGLTTSWKIGGETVETVSDFIFGGSKITVDGHCNHEIKRCLLLGRKLGLT